MTIKTKYNIGDAVKVITLTGEEILIQIDNMLISVNSKTETVVEYHSKYYEHIETDEWDQEYKRQLPILETKEAANDCPVAYIKCAVEIIEKND